MLSDVHVCNVVVAGQVNWDKLKSVSYKCTHCEKQLVPLHNWLRPSSQGSTLLKYQSFSISQAILVCLVGKRILHKITWSIQHALVDLESDHEWSAYDYDIRKVKQGLLFVCKKRSKVFCIKFHVSYEISSVDLRISRVGCRSYSCNSDMALWRVLTERFNECEQFLLHSFIIFRKELGVKSFFA